MHPVADTSSYLKCMARPTISHFLRTSTHRRSVAVPALAHLITPQLHGRANDFTFPTHLHARQTCGSASTGAPQRTSPAWHGHHFCYEVRTCTPLQKPHRTSNAWQGQRFHTSYAPTQIRSVAVPALAHLIAPQLHGRANVFTLPTHLNSRQMCGSASIGAPQHTSTAW